MKNLFLVCLSLAVIGLAATDLHAQLSVRIQADRDSYLLYEPVVYTVQLSNDGDIPLALSDGDTGINPWLNFLIFDSSERRVRSIPGKSMPDLILEPGESKALAVNLIPLYQLRSTGQYDVKVSVKIPGGRTVLTSPLRFYIGKGQEIWSESQLIDGVSREYSLHLFIEGEQLYLYSRVEEPEQRLVYGTTRLGPLVGYTEPKAMFDKNGNFHVLHISNSTVHTHSMLTAGGKLVKSDDYQQIQGRAPQFVAQSDGSFKIGGAQSTSNQFERPKLSEAQQGL
ncbi:MAG: hypothetical protein AAFY98_00205 [Verrucomicrobiota bacterium]